MSLSPPPPKIVFIVPYRDRDQQKQFFMRQMKYVMEDEPPGYYEIYFVHQQYGGSFNRGGMKNAGFLAVRDKYPDNWRDITFVFNDVDCMPYTKSFLPYATEHGRVKHFYGFRNTLGGIVSITGQTFADCGGYPMFYGYGWEDNLLQQRVQKRGFTIDRSVFYDINDPNILSFRDGMLRSVNRVEFNEYIFGKCKEGIDSVRDLQYTFEGEFIQVTKLDFGRPENQKDLILYDRSAGNAPFPDPRPRAVAARRMQQQQQQQKRFMMWK